MILGCVGGILQRTIWRLTNNPKYTSRRMSFKQINSRILELIALFELQLPYEHIEGMRDFLKHGEYGIAFEILCENLFEYDVSVDQKYIELIDQLGTTMGIDPSYWTRLKQPR
ncbi:MafI family immunity protein [bacterium]|nr:MafI family immunity protein [bacterium]